MLDVVWYIAVGGGCVAWGWRLRSLRQTTMFAPSLWMGAAFVAVTAYDVVNAVQGAAAAPPADLFLLAAAALTFCPLVAQLGAKRPHDGAWQFVVASFWLVLVLPALQTYFLRSGQAVYLHPARTWFMLGAILLGVANALGTRMWLGASLLAAVQWHLLRGHLPVGWPWSGGGSINSLLFAGALVAFAVMAKRRRPAGLDRVWLDFRDAFGALWALRFAERVNWSARGSGWPWALSWRGVVGGSAAPAKETDVTAAPLAVPPTAATTTEQWAAFEQCWVNMLRRFVTRDWIAVRMASPDALSAAAMPSEPPPRVDGAGPAR